MVLYILAFLCILIQVSGLIYSKDLYKPEKFPISVKAAYFVILEVRNRRKLDHFLQSKGTLKTKLPQLLKNIFKKTLYD